MAGKPTKKRTSKKRTAKKSARKRPANKPAQPAEAPAPVTVGPVKRSRPVKKVRGRPAGSRTQNNSGQSQPSRCPKCQSTERTPYSQTREIKINGEDPVFGAYTHVVRRWTRCKGCGQARTDRSFEYRKSAAS